MVWSVAAHAPVERERVDDVEADPAGDGVGGPPLRRAFQAVVLDLEVEHLAVGRRADAQDVVVRQPGVAHAVGEQLGDHELGVAQLPVGDRAGQPAAQHGPDLLGGLRTREDFHMEGISHNSTLSDRDPPSR